ncbi:hypothetical protein Pcinc_023556 [Petrolisthes cinctipes]|uniref:Ribosomal RNA large subunit methyltransferase K/L-like methyltransferase domain-containing protein n=1 Tax=Petrolisthes cinctipes TaxID=88211 RepID=A0AAE1FCQ8_PETCI|nr:hypothetical protein Pcinc_023556 [Petrolisthes cinctipes]
MPSISSLLTYCGYIWVHLGRTETVGELSTNDNNLTTVLYKYLLSFLPPHFRDNSKTVMEGRTMGTAELFVTCGRGVDLFAMKEINEKIPNVTNVKTLGEGKLAFTIRNIDLLESHGCKLTGRTATCVGNEAEGATDIGDKTTEEHSLPNNYLQKRTTCVTTKEEDFLYVSAVAPVFQLKLVERLFLLLYCEDVEDGSPGKLSNPNDVATHSTILTTCEEKLTGAVERINWGEVSHKVGLLRDHHASTISPRVMCQGPGTCPCLTNASNAFQQHHHQNKRKLTCPTYSKSKIVIIDNFLHQPSPSCDKVEMCRKLADENGTTIENSVYGSVVPNMNEEYRVNKNHHISVEETNSVSGMQEHSLSKGQQEHVNLKAVKEEESPAQKHSDENDGEKKSFRVSCRISGFYKTVLQKNWLNQTVIKILKKETLWSVNWREPLIDLYINITDSHFIIGVTLTPRPLSLRAYAPHLTLRSTLAYLVACLAQIPPGSTVLDPMCGGGTILLEAATSFDVDHLIASDVNLEQLQVAKCNLRTLYSPVSFLQASAIALPLHSSSVDIVLCDFPFGRKHKVKEEDSDLLIRVLKEMSRLLVCGGCAVFLLSPRQHHYLIHAPNATLQAQGLPLQHKDSHMVSMGETYANLTIFTREERAS